MGRQNTFLVVIRRITTRMSAVFLAALVIATIVLAIYVLTRYFNIATYRFVAMFLLVILGSNLLAKTIRSYVEA